jgi:hypothetical protein
VGVPITVLESFRKTKAGEQKKKAIEASRKRRSALESNHKSDTTAL